MPATAASRHREFLAKPSGCDPQQSRRLIDSAEATARPAGLGLGSLSGDGVLGTGLDCLMKMKRRGRLGGRPRQGILELRLECGVNCNTKDDPRNHQAEHCTNGTPIELRDFAKE